jgi:hypothetical protein
VELDIGHADLELEGPALGPVHPEAGDGVEHEGGADHLGHPLSPAARSE